MKKMLFSLLCAGLFITMSSNNPVSYIIKIADDAPRRAEVLFLGNIATLHDSGKYAPFLSRDLFARGINITYTTDTNALNTANLSKYDGLIIYANYDRISPAKEKALKDFVESGKGLIPIHAASACFTNSAWYIQAVGGKFKSHKTGVFSAATTNKTHPVMQGVSEFSSWDETYVHSNINPDMTVLQERVEGGTREPWTWVRNQGKGRVFYTAGGHNDSTWTKKDFVKLIGNGVLWAIGDKIAAHVASFRPPVLRYDDTTTVPNYPRPVPYTNTSVTPKDLPRYQFALTPAQSMQTMQTPVDFKIELFAAEPDIVNPIAMSWDEKGRLWIVESVDYPNTFIETDGAANDRIKICEDTNKDGKADKFTVFADKLNIPTSIVFANGGVVVAMAPNFVFLKDTNGDDKADVREIISSGWGKSDTHAGPSNLQYGFDNKIWGVVGYSGYSGQIDGPFNGVKPAQAVFRLNTNGKGLEFLAQSTNNTWGLGFTEDNHVFVSTANGDHSDYFSMPARFMQRTLPAVASAQNFTPGAARSQGRAPQASVQPLQIIQGHTAMHTLTPNLRQVDVWGGFTAAAGHHFYTARNFPKEYWNRIAFINEPTGRLIHKAVIERKGAGFTEKDDWNLLASNDEWVGPVQTQVGPDGSVWVADWYNYIIQHNPNPAPVVVQGKRFTSGRGGAYNTPMRDINHGRIYRIVYNNARANTSLPLSRTDLPGLINALKNDNMLWRMHAQRLLVETKNMAALPELFKLVNDKKVDEIGLNSPALHALWTLHGLGALNGSNAEALQTAINALTHPAAAVRRAAAEVLPKNTKSAEAILKAGLLNDADLNTRMHALIVIAEMPQSAEIGKALYTASLNTENVKDEWIAKALLAAAVAHQKSFTTAAATKTELPAEGQPLSLLQRIIKGLTLESYSYTIANSPVKPAVDILPVELKNKEITIKTTIGPRAAARGGQALQQQQPVSANTIQGFVIGQGDNSNGLALYIQDGKVNFVVNQNGKSYKATTTEALPDRYALVAKLAAGGEMSIEVDGKQAGKARAVSLFTTSPAGVIRTGADNPTGKIGVYPGEFPFTGTAQGLTLELKSGL